MANVIAPFGHATVTVAAGGSIAVYTQGAATLSQKLSFANHPDAIAAVGTVTNGHAVFGSYSAGATILIDSGGQQVWYETGAAPVVDNYIDTQGQVSPTAVNATGSVSATAMLGGIVTSTTAAAVAGTIPTGTTMDAASEFAVNDSFDWSVINTGPNTFTVTAASGHTIVGAAAVATATSGRFRTRKTAENTFVTYRLS